MRIGEPFSHTTVRSALRMLEEKSYRLHAAEGKFPRYAPAVASHLTTRSALAWIPDTMFAGSPELVLTQLVSDRRLDRRRLHCFFANCPNQDSATAMTRNESRKLTFTFLVAPLC